MNIVLVIAPHPDDETLGCGGAILRHIAHGDRVHWMIASDMRVEYGYAATAVNQRQSVIEQVAAAYGFSGVHRLGFAPAKLDLLPKGELVQAVGSAIKTIAPTVVYLPFRGDVHSDHAVVFDAAVSCAKWFRYPSIQRVLCYETLSETDFGMNPEAIKFSPNVFVDISAYINDKIRIAQMYGDEMNEYPFPRSEEALRALAQVRGVACGCHAAESFMLLREICK